GRGARGVSPALRSASRLTDVSCSSMSPQGVERLDELRRQRRFDLQHVPQPRMTEPQAKRMQRLPGQQHLIRLRVEVRHQVRQPQTVAAAIDLVRENGAADARQVDANLMRPPGPRLYAAKCEAAKALDHFVI